MCNLYRMTQTTAEVAGWFGVEDAASGSNFASEIYPGYPGAVIAEGEVKVMNWGFPLVLTGRQGQKLKPKPVTNAREDKLQAHFWRDSFAHRRCLVPVTQWAEAEGIKGRMTRTWYGLGDHPVFAVAGLWRASVEWGNVYTLVMVDGHHQMAEVHDRMPLILDPAGQREWTQGSPDAALALCRTWDGALTVDRTGEPWVAGAGGRPAQQDLL